MSIAVPVIIAVAAVVLVAVALVSEARYYERHPEKTPPDVSPWP